MIKLFKTRVNKDKYVQSEWPMAKYIPYLCHWDNSTILTKDYSLMKVIKVQGFSFETADDEDLDVKKGLRNSLFKSFSSGNISLYFHIVRKRKTLVNLEDFDIGAEGSSNDDFTLYLNEQWQKKYADFPAFFNELYVSVIYSPDKAGAAKIGYIFNKIRQSSTQEAWKSDLKEMYDSLEEASSRIINTFANYGARLLKGKRMKSGYCCEILEFLSTIVNTTPAKPVLVQKGNIDQYLPQARIFFGSKTLETRTPLASKFAGIISIMEYGPQTSAGIFDGFLQMPFEFILTQSFSAANRSVALNRMQLQQNRLIQVGDKATSQIIEISRALDMATSGNLGFGDHHFSILCLGEDIKDLENNLALASVELANCGIRSVREHINLEAVYWGQLPGNSKYIVRKNTINTLNLASFASMHNYPLGKAASNHWGEYVTILNTTSGTPYYFNFHVQDVGHTTIIGPTGAGKTLLMNFLCAQAQKFKPRMYYFDKDLGAEIFIRAIKGVYTVIDPSKKCYFNPLKLPDTGENRTFLLEWLRSLITIDNQQVTPEEIRLLTIAIEGNYKLQPNARKLSNIVPFLGISGQGTLAARLAMWHSNGSHANIFDNDEDHIDLVKARVFGFEMAPLLQDKMSVGPVLLYVFHRINLSLKGYPTIIVMDEAWALIDNPTFAPKIRNWLKVLRKLNTFVIFATQSVEDAAKSAISDTLIQQCPTQIFLPNLKATSLYRSAFMLTAREYSLIKNTDPASRYFLIKQNFDAVIARLELEGLSEIISVLSARPGTIKLMHDIMREYGEETQHWLPIFYERIRGNV